MLKTSFSSKGIKSRFCMFKVNLQQSQDPEQDKEYIMNRMNDYLEKNEGRLINIQLLTRSELIVYFIVNNNHQKVNNWQLDVKSLLDQY